MEVILLQDVDKLGRENEMVKVRSGFARNFLIPQGKAKRATPDNLKAIEARRADLEKAAAEKLATAQALAEKLEGATLRISQKSGVDGRLFGSVTNVDVVEALKKQGTDVEKAMVRMPSGPLKQVGDHPVSVALHTDVTAHITVHVVGETVGN